MTQSPEFYVEDDYVEFNGASPKRRQAAIEHSIRKWQFIAKYVKKAQKDNLVVPIADGESCALCQLYAFKTYDEDDCLKCPVYKATGKPHCDDTPYYSYESARSFDYDMARNAALREVKFLKSLQ